jgi:hypothetical protein
VGLSTYGQTHDSVNVHSFIHSVISLRANRFNHYERLRDVQTLALLACVLSIDPPEVTLNLCDVNVDNLFKLDDKRITSRPSAPSLQVVKEKHEMTTLLNPAQENVYDQYK